MFSSMIEAYVKIVYLQGNTSRIEDFYDGKLSDTSKVQLTGTLVQ
ncbi:hypothetical protein ACP8HI_26295 [Paenibacillus sp. FA6]